MSGDSLNRGWRAAWCDPGIFENTFVREVIKGPFPTPKIACLIPFFKNCQKECWAQFLSPLVKTTPQNTQHVYQMTKENEDLLEAVKNNYGLSIGHGIPDPWITVPYCGMSHSHNEEMTDFLKKFIFQLLDNKKNNNQCICCERKYLFGCPDKTEEYLKNLKNGNFLNCKCPTCHGKDEKTTDSECNENCKCIKTIKAWILDNIYMFRGKNQMEAEKDETASFDSSKSPNRKCRNKRVEIKEPTEVYTCTCGPIDSSMVKTPTPKTTPTEEDKYKKFPQVGFNFTPQDSKMNITSSKESQDEVSECGVKKSFSRNSSDCYFKACSCFLKCPNCCGYDYTTSTTQGGHSGQFFANYNVPFHIAPSNPFSIPVCETHSQPTRDKKKKKDKSSDKKKKKERKKKEKAEVSDTPSKSQDSQLDDSSSLRRTHGNSILKNTTKTSNDISETSDSRRMPSHISLSLDHLKYLTDQKLKMYLQRKELSRNSLSSRYSSFQSISPLSSTFRNLCEGESLGVIALQKCKPFRYYRRETAGESSCDDSRSLLREWRFKPTSKKFNSGAQTSLSIIDEIDSSRKDIPTNVKFFKEVVESDESGVCVPLRTYDKTYRENRIRRRLIANRKRRKKLISKRHWYTIPSSTDRMSKFVQATENSEDSTVRHRTTPYEKRVSFDFDVNDSRFVSVPSSLQLLEERRRLSDRKIISGRRGNFENVLDKISHNSGTSWSTNTLKNIVDDFMIEKKPLRHLHYDAGIQTSNRNL